jgi:hypothetical protein
MLETYMTSNTSTHNDDRFDYYLRIQPMLSSPDSVLCSYLKTQGNAIYSHKEMVLSALRAYWMPMAYEHYRHHSDAPFTDDDLRNLARTAISHLRERAEMLNHHFCAEMARMPILPFGREERLLFISQQAQFVSPITEPDWGINRNFETL